ncbi:MAG: hypothetical protein RLZZ501_1924 [Pseudomonadota bacterium]
MRFATFLDADGRSGLAVTRDGTDFHGWGEDDPAYPGSLDDLIQGEADLGEIADAAATAARIDLDTVTLAPPLRRPGKILCVGLNYADHARETGRQPPDYPTLFVRFPSTLVGAGAALVRPRASIQLDYEGELVAVIGRGGRHIPRDRALDHVVAYSIFNDASVRDYQAKASQWTMGKNFDATGGFGPWLVTADMLPPGGAGLRIRTRLGGAVVQEANTDDMIFDLATLIERISEVMTLAPGDLIVTGTPPGVGVARTPPLFMKPGDLCEVEIERIGLLRNLVVAES